MSEHDAGGEQVRAFVGNLEVRLLRAHVIGFTGDDFALLVGEKTPGLGDSEIGELHVALESDHDVFEADIAVDEAEGPAIFVGLGVGIGEAASDAADDENCQFARQDAAFVSQLLGKLLEVNAPDQFHRDEVNAAGLAEMISLNDVGVDQVGDELGFADEVLDELFLVGVVLADDFDGDTLDEIAGAVLLGLIDDAHAAFENFADDVVPKLVLDGEQRHRLMVMKLGLKSS